MARLNISAWAIRRPVPSLVLFMVLIALGVFSFQQLPVMRFPNIDIPVVQVTITQAGAAPSELETQVTKRVEDAIAGVPGVKHITSTIVEGSSTTLVEFHLESPVDRAVNDVKDAIARIRSELPRTIDEPITQRLDIEGLPIVTYSARAPSMTPEELSWFVDDACAGAAERERRLQGRACRRRRARNPRRSRSGSAAGPWHHCGRRQSPAQGDASGCGWRPW